MGNPEEGVEKSDLHHDFLSDRPYLMFVGGHTISRKSSVILALNYAYLTILLALFVFLELMSGWAIVVSFPDVVETIHAFHNLLLVTVMNFGIFVRLLLSERLHQTSALIKEGVYRYEGELPDEEHSNIKRRGVKEIRKLSKAFSTFLCFSTISNTVFVSLVQLMVINEDTSSKSLNPYLPQPIYMPFNTRTPIGFAIGFFIDFIYIAYLCIVVVCMDEIYLSCTVQMKTQFEILNHSLSCLEERAYRMFLSENPSEKSATKNKLYKRDDFQDCLYRCFRNNVKHHHALLRLKDISKTYTGSCFLMVFSLASVILAAHVVLILENPGIHIMVNFMVTLTAELLYTLHYCWYGEVLLRESSEVYHSLYRTPWVDCNNRCRRLLVIMMANTRNPVKVKTVGFNFTASLETFGSIISAMYQIMNVVRNKKK